MQATIPGMLSTVARDRPAHAAVVDGDRSVSYGELLARVGGLSEDLAAQGVGAGVPVALAAANSVEFVAGFLAICNAGGAVVPLHRQSTAEELWRAMDRAGSGLLLFSERSQGSCREAVAASGGRIRALAVEALNGPSRAGSQSGRGIDPDTTAVLQMSSGSTGEPKVIARTHRQLATELDALRRRLGMAADDRVLGVAPFSHVNGLVRSMLNSLTVGATLIALPEFQRRSVVRVIEEHRPTIFIGVPFMFSVLADSHWSRPPELSSLRWCISSSAPLKMTYVRRFQERFGHFVRQLYGSTETGTISVNLEADAQATGESVGLPLDGVEIRVVDEAGDECEPGRAGEIAIRSRHMSAGYVRADVEAMQAFRDGWYFTGDVGFCDRSGRYFLNGRRKLFINRAGFKLDPTEIERLIESHPAVREAVVVGVPTVYGDEQVKAFVVRRSQCSERDIVRHCRGRIADFKVPAVIEFLDELPRTATGKIVRTALTGRN